MDVDDEDESVGAHRSDGHGAASGPFRVGDEGFDDEVSTGIQNRMHRAEQVLLTKWVGDVEKCVEGHEHDAKSLIGKVVDHVTLDDADRAVRVLGRESFEHGRAAVEADHVGTGGGEWESESTGTDAELEERPVPTDRAKTRHGRVDPADVPIPVVVDIGEGVAVRLLVVSVHRISSPCGNRPRQCRAAFGAVTLRRVAERLIYLDHAATTPMRPEAVAAMTPFLTEIFANPSGSHRFARQARRAVDEARDSIAAAIGCDLGEIIFTSCGTESDNMAVRGAAESRAGRPVCVATEHHAVLHAVERLDGAVVRVGSGGEVDLDHLALVLGEGPVSSVSVMAVNNETGVVADLIAISRLVRRLAPGALLHTDAVQAACWIDLRDIWSHVDSMALSAHKFGGPKGVGILAVRAGNDLAPLILGGGQERDRRSGTHNVAGIVATAVALDRTDHDRAHEVDRISTIREVLFERLTAIEGVHRTVAADASVPGVAHVCIPEVESEALLYLLDEKGVCASSASACASGAMEPSHVLAAMGVSTDLSRGSLRLSFGHTTTLDDVVEAADVVTSAVERVRTAARRLGGSRT